MHSARSLYRLYALVALAATAAVSATIVAVVRATSFRPESVTALLQACRRSFMPHLGPDHILVLLGGALSVAVMTRGAASAVRRYRATRRTLASLPLVGTLHSPVAARIVADSSPQAFCTGLLRPRIYVSTAALERLTPDELAAVLEHETHHAARRDPLRLFAAHVAADALFFLPALRGLRDRYGALAELAADEAAVRRLGDAQPLASALIAFGERPSGAVVGFSPERIDHLLGARPRWNLSLPMLLRTLVAIGALTIAAVVGALSTEVAQINASAMLVQSCSLIVLSVALLAAVTIAREFRRDRCRR